MEGLTCYEGHIAESIKKGDIIEITLCSKSGNTKLDLYCYAEVKWKGLFKKKPFLFTTEMPIVIEAHDTKTKERFIIFDEAIHGYNAIFCEDYTNVDLTKRLPLKKLVSAEKVIVELYYGIDYDEEKDDYEFDKNGKLITERGDALDWDYIKTNGIDWIKIFYIDEHKRKKNILDFELA